jgi:hypothetical protein
MWKRGERKLVLDRRKRRRERERERKERGEILNEDGREIRWMKEKWKRRERIEKERGGG